MGDSPFKYIKASGSYNNNQVSDMKQIMGYLLEKTMKVFNYAEGR